MLLYITSLGQESGGVDFRTLGNQTAARVLEEVSEASQKPDSLKQAFGIRRFLKICHQLFHVSSLDLANPFLFDGAGSGWK